MVKSNERNLRGSLEQTRVIVICPVCSETDARLVNSGGARATDDVCRRCGAQFVILTVPVSVISSGTIRDRSN